jgi:hypothetical protein
MELQSTFLLVTRFPLAVFHDRNSELTTLFSSLWRQINLASKVYTMGSGLLLPLLSFVPSVLVESPSLPVYALQMCKSLSGLKILFAATGRDFW